MRIDLGIEDFPHFFRAVHGYAPFRWQTRLAEHVHGTGRWPDLVDLPTGAGKTAAIDVAVFVRALRDDQPRRIVLVVDRRVIVHQAYKRAQALATALTHPEDDVVRAVADRIRAAAYDRCLAEPMLAAELRGGIELDETWAMRPDIPAVLVSTVDQVGSRLLFRGYGVSRGMRPVHAGLLGNDALLLLDEVHLARPFAETLRAVGDHYRRLGNLPDRWQVVELSATPATRSGTQFGLLPEDRADALLARRLDASKPVDLAPVNVRGSAPEGSRKAMVERCVVEAQRLAGAGHVKRVGVVVNRVQTAVDIHAALDKAERSACLLTGRMRPLDRAVIQADLDADWLLGRDRAAATVTRFLVATQTIEAGADLDLDALVTECAPFDSLVQRFGRVDRDGLLSAAGTASAGVILATSTQAKDNEDPVYGAALAETWKWLGTQGQLDFGPDRRPVPSEEAASLMRVATRPPPVLLPSHLDSWAQTSPQPHADPDPDLWLHGLRDSADLDISVVWRVDIDEPSDEDEQPLLDWLSACPPTAGEVMTLPIGAVRRWLKEQGAQDVADVEGASSVPDTGRRDPERAPGRAVIRWRPGERGDEGSSVVWAAQLRPGDTIVVPAAYGGVGKGRSWDPGSTRAVTDLATGSQRSRRGRLVLRLVDKLVIAAPRPPLDGVDDTDLAGAWVDAVRNWLFSSEVDDWLAAPAEVSADTAVLAAVRALRDHDPELRTSVNCLFRPSGPAFVLDGPWPGTIDDAVVERSDTVDSEPETSSFIGRTVTLKQHLDDVADWAGAMATKCGLPPSVAEDLAMAGRLHDLGKADPRFQQLLVDGCVPGELLAKSDGRRTGAAARRQAQRRAGYPDRARHELLSASLVEHGEGLRQEANDWDLVVHLVASHHGHARPSVPVTLDERPVPVAVPATVAGIELSGSSEHRLHRLDAGVTERFWSLTERYGWYGLAWLEAILRLADHRASAERQGGRRND